MRSVVPKSPRDASDPATRTFQALRIAVNEELDELDRAVDASEHVLNVGGRLIVVSFHSLEDIILKQYIREKAAMDPNGPRHQPERKKSKKIYFEPMTKRGLRPSGEEVEKNPRSRSARLRGAVRTAEGIE